jgi:hypothetical protein
VARLVEADLAPAGQPNGRLDAPLGFLDLGGGDALGGQRSHGGFQIVAQEIEDRAEDVVICVALEERTRGGVNAQLGRGEPKDQPSTARIDCGKPECVTKECPIGLGLLLYRRR